MSYLLDANVVSEWTKPRPDEAVAAWLASADEDRIFLSVITLAELRHGVERLPLGARRARLNTWLNEDLLHRFTTRVLPVDAQTADIWGRLIARAEEGGRPAAAMDAFIAATAAQHDLTVVTRNVADFSAFGVRLANPWRQTPPPTA